MKPLRIHDLPLHPALVHFPVAGWSASTLLLLAAIFDAGAALADAAYWCNVVALATGIVAMLAGFIEAAAAPERAGTRDAIAHHMLLAVGAWSAYLVALLLQVKGMMLVATFAAVAGFVLLLFAGHAGARLVYPHGLPEHADIP